MTALSGVSVSLISHVAFETTAALSRMPEGHRVAPAVVLAWLERRFPGEWLTLPSPAVRSALHSAVEHGVRGGSLYDALIAATAEHHGHTLLTADRRATSVYAALDVDVTYLEPSPPGAR